MGSAFALFLVGSPAARANARDAPRDLIVSVRSDRLFERLGLSCTATTPTSEFQAYRVDGGANPSGVYAIGVAIFPSTADASRGMRYCIASSMSMGPTALDLAIGDECEIYSGTFFLRTQNVVAVFNWVGELPNAVAFAERLDTVLLSDDEVAPKGPATAAPNEFGFIRPDDSGLPATVIRHPLYVRSGHPLGYNAPSGERTAPSRASEGREVSTRRSGPITQGDAPAKAARDLLRLPQVLPPS